MREKNLRIRAFNELLDEPKVFRLKIVGDLAKEREADLLVALNIVANMDVPRHLEAMAY